MKYIIIGFLKVALAAFFIAGAQAQQVGSVPAHSIPIGKGPGVQGFTSLAPGAAGTCLVSNGAGNDPIFGACATGSLGIDTNTLRSMTGSGNILNSDCGKTVNATTGFFTITLPAVAGFDPNCQLTVVNGDTNAGKKLSGFPTTMTSSGMLWPGQGVNLKIINGAWKAPINPGRWKAPANLQVYQDIVFGNDANDCLAAGTGRACKQFHQTLRINAKDYYDFSGFTSWPTCLITVNLADNRASGIAYDGAHLAFVPVGSEGRGSICVKGNSTTPSNVIVSDSGTASIGAYGPISVQLSYMQLGWEGATAPTANAGLDAEDGANIWIQPGVIFGKATTTQIQAGNRGSVTALANFSVSAGATSLITNSAGIVDLNSRTVTFSNSPVYSGQTVVGFAGSTTILSAVTWTNGGTVTTPGTTNKFFCRGATTIETDTGNGNSIPGTTGGSVGTGCIVF